MLWILLWVESLQACQPPMVIEELLSLGGKEWLAMLSEVPLSPDRVSEAEAETRE